MAAVLRTGDACLGTSTVEVRFLGDFATNLGGSTSESGSVKLPVSNCRILSSERYLLIRKSSMSLGCGANSGLATPAADNLASMNLVTNASFLVALRGGGFGDINAAVTASMDSLDGIRGS